MRAAVNRPWARPFPFSTILLLIRMSFISQVYAEDTRATSPAGAIAEEATIEVTTTEESSAETVNRPDDAAIVRFFAKSKQENETRANKAAQWVDSFFRDPEYEVENASSQFRLRPELYLRQEQGLKPRLKGSFRFNLPSLEGKVRIYAGTSDYDGSIEQETEDDIRDPVVGLQFLGKARGNWNTSLFTGLKGNELAGQVGPRVRYKKSLSSRVSFQFTQKVLWQTNNEWDVRSRFDLDLATGKQYFFRQMVEGRWRGEHSSEEGYRTRISSFLTRKLGNDAGLQAELSVVFKTEPDSHVDKYVAAWRFRKRSTVDWLYYEVVPILSWEDRFDFDLNPGIRIRLEVLYGTGREKQYWRQSEESPDFHW